MEAEFLRWLRERLPPDPRIPVSLGSDAAIVECGRRGSCVVTTDAITEGVDFRLAVDAPHRVGRKALAVNLSDLAAMAAQPVAAFVSLVLPRSNAAELARRLYEGILPLASEFGIAIAGGDTNTWDGELVISITALGETTPRGAWTRGGARPGDVLLVTGQFGGSFLGKQFDFTPRVCEALKLNEQFEIHAATDVSDGLSLDLTHILTESGCGAELEVDQIPVAPAAAEYAAQRRDGRSPLEHALSDGEDFELILAVAPESARRMLAEQPLTVPLTAIGRCVETPGLWARDAHGRRPLTPRGYQH